MHSSSPDPRQGLPRSVWQQLLPWFLATVAGLASAVAVQAQSVPSGFALQAVVGEPFGGSTVGFAFLPDGRTLIIEKDTGNVRLAAVGSSTSAVIATTSGLQVFGERGLLGIAVDPAWPTRPYLYFHGTYNDGTIRVTMRQASGALSNPASTSVTLASPYVILGGIADVNSNHNGGTLRFGPDGFLYVSIGDDAFNCNAQDTNLLTGKILRLDVANMPGTGGGPPAKGAITPPDNPFPGPNENARLVFAAGLRNPFRFCIDPLTNDVYIGDVGEDSWEEMDVATYDGYVGNNYGWPAFEGLESRSVSCTLDPPFTSPIYVYPNPSGGSASVIGGPLYRRVPGSASSFPFAYDGNLFLADVYNGFIRRLVRSGSNWSVAPAVPGQANPQQWASGIDFISDLQTGPDGGLYFMVLSDGGSLSRGLYRIVDTTVTDALDVPGNAGLQAFPNPAPVQQGLTIRYRLVRPETARLRIYDAAGRLVRTLGPVQGTFGSIGWDGKTERGVSVAAGVYSLRLETGGKETARRKLTLLQ